MSAPAPRPRMFAGPNGSGKSTIKEVIPDEWLGIYINPDEIEKSIRRDGFLSLADFSLTTTHEILFGFLKASRLLAKANLLAQVDLLAFQDQRLCLVRWRWTRTGLRCCRISCDTNCWPQACRSRLKR